MKQYTYYLTPSQNTIQEIGMLITKLPQAI